MFIIMTKVVSFIITEVFALLILFHETVIIENTGIFRASYLLSKFINNSLNIIFEMYLLKDSIEIFARNSKIYIPDSC